MGQQLNVMISVQIVGGANLSENQSIDVDAVDSLDVQIDKGAKKSVEVQPASDANKIKFLMITTKLYDGKVTYKIDAKTVVLDGPHILVGSGAVGLLEKAPQTVEFSNGGADKASVKIVVGRAAS